MKEELNTLANLASLATLKNLQSSNILDPVTTQLTTISSQISQIPITDLSGVRLLNIEAKIDQIINTQIVGGLTFTPLTLNPTYALNADQGWETAPTNVSAIADGYTNTSTNLFSVTGSAFRWGEIQINPGITIPNFTRLAIRLGMQNPVNLRSGGEIAVLDASVGTWTNIWATLEVFNNSADTIFDIDRIIPFVWDRLRFRIWDIGQFAGRMRIYDLKVWRVD